MRKSTWKVREKSGNFVTQEKWEPCSSASLWESGCNKTITSTVKQLRAGLDGHRSPPNDHTGQPQPNVFSCDLVQDSTIVPTDIASFVKKEQVNSSFRRRGGGGGSIDGTFVCPPNQNYVCSSNAHDSNHVHISHFTIGGKQYCWDTYLAPSYDVLDHLPVCSSNRDVLCLYIM